jgi:ATP-dependent DNA helicase RecG
MSLRRGVISFVAQPVDVAIELLNTDYFRGYAAARKLTRPFPECLEHVGLTKRGADGTLRPTRAAVLLFAEDPAGVLNEKCAIRLFHYKGDAIEHNEQTNLLRHATTIRGPLVTQIRDAVSAVIDSLAAGLQMGPLGFEVAQKYPVRVLREAITNAVIHRDYFTPGDIHIRIFGNRIEVESPGRFPHAITPSNIRTRGSQPRNRQIVDHLRDFPNPPNLDAGEGVPMMVELMDKSSLYPPIYLGHSELGREAVAVVLINEAMPTVWKQIEAYLEKNDTIGNAEVRALLKKPDTLAASKLIRSWVDSGLLVLSDPAAAKKFRRYRRPGLRTDLSFHFLRDKKMNSSDTK